MQQDITAEKTILQNLVLNEEFTRKTITYIKSEYFTEKTEKAVFELIEKYFQKSSQLPTATIIYLSLNEVSYLNEAERLKTKALIEDVFSGEPLKDLDWLTEQTEEWCRERALYNAIETAISIYDKSNKELTCHVIPELMKNALAVSFNTSIGQDWIDDAEERYNSYISSETKIPFDLDILNKITNGGVTRKTFCLILAGIHIGKTMAMTHLAAAYIKQGYDVLYFSMEMGETEILQRVDANLLNIPMSQLAYFGKEKFLSKIEKLKEKSYGKLKVIQYPTSMAHVGHFKNALSELRSKLNWKPTVIFVDYIGIVASSRIKPGATNSYFYLKSVSEELRALAIEQDVVVWSAMQLTRTGMQSTDVDMTDVGESISIPAIADLSFALIRTEEMDQLNQLVCKQLKNRFRNMGFKPKFILGCDFETQTYYDVTDSLENDISPSTNETQNNRKNRRLEDDYNTSKNIYGERDYDSSDRYNEKIDYNIRTTFPKRDFSAVDYADTFR